MKKTTMKRIVAVILSALMVLGTMIVPTFAAADQEVTYPYLTRYNTDYNYSIMEGNTETITLQVQRLSSDYENVSPFQSSEEAASIKWSQIDGSGANLTYLPQSIPQDVSGGYVAMTLVEITADTPVGVYVIQAQNTEGNTIAFTITVIPSTAIDSVSNITTVGYNGKVDSNNKPLYGPKTDSVSRVAETGVNYPTAMDAIKQLTGDSCKIVTQYGSPIVRAIGDLVNSTDGLIGWQYRVYSPAQDGTLQVNKISENVGAAVYMLSPGDVVVWAYGAYVDAEGKTLFPDTYTVPKVTPTPDVK